MSLLKGWLGGGKALRVGDVIYARLETGTRNPKSRRCIVLSLNDPVPTDLDRRITVVGVMSDNSRYDPANTADYPPTDFHPVPYAADGRCCTSFDRPCAAVSFWVQTFRRDELAESASGYLRRADRESLERWLRDLTR